MDVENGIEPLNRHPVAGLSPSDRQLAHCEALGEILAAIALRKADQTTTGAKTQRSPVTLPESLQRLTQEVASVS